MRSVDLCVLTANSAASAPINKHTEIYGHIYIEKGERIRLVMIPCVVYLVERLFLVIYS